MVHIEEGEDLKGVIQFEADCLLVQVYGNHVNQKSVLHMDRFISDNEVWQMRWRILVSQSVLQYHAPQGGVGRHFIHCLADKVQRVREKLCNADRPMVFMWVILQTTLGERKVHDIKCRIMRHLDLWEVGQHAALCADTVVEILSWIARNAHVSE